MKIGFQLKGEWWCLTRRARGDFIRIQGRKKEEDGESYKKRNFIVCIIYQRYFLVSKS